MADPDCPKIRIGKKLFAAEGKEKVTSMPLADEQIRIYISGGIHL